MNQFKEYFFDKFLEWEKKQPRKRSTVTAFARYLSDNSLNVTVPQPVVEGWINGRYKPGAKYAPVLAEKLGPEIYDYLDIPKLDPMLIYIQSNWSRLSPDLQHRINEEIAAYLAIQGEHDNAASTAQP